MTLPWRLRGSGGCRGVDGAVRHGLCFCLALDAMVCFVLVYILTAEMLPLYIVGAQAPVVSDDLRVVQCHSFVPSYVFQYSREEDRTPMIRKVRGGRSNSSGSIEAIKMDDTYLLRFSLKLCVVDCLLTSLCSL